MPLSDDQRAMLRVLAQGELGYEDLAALKGLSVDEVRAEVADAVAQLIAAGEPVPALPAAPNPAAGAEPASEAKQPPAPEPVSEKPAVPEPPAEKAAPAPEPVAKQPVKETPAPTAPAAAPPKRTPPPRPKISLPGGGGARAAILAGGAVLVILVVILLIGGGDDSSDSGGSGSTTTATEGTDTTASNSSDATQAVLEATDGSDAAGLASFGRVKNALVLQIEASGLDPSGKGESYTVWLAQSPQKMLPLATTTVPASGKIGARTEVPTEVLGYLADETFTKIVVTKTADAALQASLKKATAAKEAPKYTGEEVLNGTVTGPIVGAANKDENE